ncbi:ABC transporter ATP-binding protein [Cellulomonas sp. P24]|uniref:ABC transporter ATP-binding protein n=1 Tax=Cellulomonas sp. P24 TaxID=2885206 RepID=UPI00216AB5FC|nr:ABC transporter ATP-binding protein [Cellulomonas sp. P24]MCR6493018.1 ABC transporter ATP-binding protein [Cellulomonas sp. P24]
MTDPTPLLSIRDLSVVFRSRAGDVPAVSGVTIDVHAGRTVAVVGESGSGKSTTAAAVNRLLPDAGRITTGQVLLDGRDLASLTEREMIAVRGAHIGFVPQDPMSNLNPLMRVGDQIAEALEVHGRTSGNATRTAVVELLDMVGIADPEQRLHQYPHEFSGGMRQRVLIAMGLACRPRLLIADEPTSALDVTVQRKILDELDELVGRLGTAVMLITHDLGLAAERADTIVVMNQGRVVESGTAEQILDAPQDPYTKRLLDAAPSLTSTRWVRASPVVAHGAATLEEIGRGTAEVHGATPTDAPTPAVAPLVAVNHLSKTFVLRSSRNGAVRELTAVSDVSFTIPRGRTVSLVGESGSGKSTTANIVLGLETASEGHVLFDGVDIAPLSRRELFAFRRRIQPVFQNPYASLDPRYTVEESIAEPMRVHRVGHRRSRRERVATLLDQVALPAAMASRLPHELSGGQRQRVAIARALALSPELVVLDEAVSALDVIVQAQILELLAGLQRELGLSYLFISHDLAVVRMISDEVHVMKNGCVVESGTPDELFARPREDYTRELLAAIPGGRRAA